jgi:hypothetical protein
VQRLRAEPPGLAYAPLFAQLATLPGGDAVMADARAQCLAAVQLAAHHFVRGAAATAERATGSLTGESSFKARADACPALMRSHCLPWRGCRRCCWLKSFEPTRAQRTAVRLPPVETHCSQCNDGFG